MSRTIVPISKHNLDITSIRSLALDLSERLAINVKYGYCGSKDQFRLMGINRENGFFHQLGTIEKDNTRPTYRLQDVYYLLKLLYKKFGDGLFDMLEYLPKSSSEITSEMIAREKKEMTLVDYELDPVGDENYPFININSDHLSYNSIYNNWSNFCGYLIDGWRAWRGSDLVSYRQLLREYVQKLGGEEVLLISDQSEGLKGMGQGDEAELTWKEVRKQTTQCQFLKLVDIPRILQDQIYREEIKNHTSSELIFIDDFRDM